MALSNVTELALSPISALDLRTLICGRPLGKGLSRYVFELAYDAEFIVKMDCYDSRYQNMREIMVWRDVKEYPALRQWFAPVTAHSSRGDWLIMPRTSPVTLDEVRRRLPKVPAMFTDLKPNNWGKLGRRIVCHDYGTINFELTNTRMRRADWWEEAGSS